MFILWWIIVGLIAGFITGKLMKDIGFGPIGDIVVGIIGAVVGGFIMRSLGFAGQGGLIYTCRAPRYWVGLPGALVSVNIKPISESDGPGSRSSMASSISRQQERGTGAARS